MFSASPRNVIPLAIGLATLFACQPDGDEGGPNQTPTVRITEGVPDGGTTEYRTTFHYLGVDPDGFIDHYLYAVDDTCLCTYPVVVRFEVEHGTVSDTVWIKTNDPAECESRGIPLKYPHPDSIWKRVDRTSVSLTLPAPEPVGGDPPMSTGWHGFFVKAVDDDGAVSPADGRFFDATTVAPMVWLEEPVPEGSDPLVSWLGICPLDIRWRGLDSDAGNPVPIGYQLKLVRIPDAFIACDAQSGENPPYAVTYVTNEFLQARNWLLPDSLIVPSHEEPTNATFHATDWWPKRDDPFPDTTIRLEHLQDDHYMFAVRAVDEAGAVTPDDGLFCRDTENLGNCFKLSVAGHPVGPALLIEEASLGQIVISAPGMVVHREVPSGRRLQLRWKPVVPCETDLPNYDFNFGLDIPDPGCDSCQAPGGIGGWAGFGEWPEVFLDITFAQADEGEHTLSVWMRNRVDPQWSIRAAIVFDVVVVSFTKPVLWVADYRDAMDADCTLDPYMFALVNQAVAPYLPPDQAEVDVWLPFDQESCEGSDVPVAPPWSVLEQYRAVLWTVSPHGGASALGQVTRNPSDWQPNEVLSHYMNFGGRLIVWGDLTIGALLGDYYPGETWIPELPQFPDNNFGPGTFVWDIMKFKTQFDYVGRGVSPQMQSRCSGIIGYEATQMAVDEGYPAGLPDPTGYDASRTAIWFDAWQGMRNPGGGNLAVGMRGQPALLEAGLDTLYNFVTNSWSYDQIDPGDNYPTTAVPDPDAHCPTCVREACRTSFLSPFERRPVAIRYEDPAGQQGRLAWLGTRLDAFDPVHDDDVATLLRRLVAWVMED